VGPLGVLGLGLALWRGRARARVTVVAVLAFAVLASEASVSVLGLDLFIPGLKNLQFPRFAFMMKPLLASLAGLAAVVVWIGVREVVGAATRSAGEVSGDAASDAAGDAAGGARRGATHDAALAGSAPPRAPGSWAGEGILGPRDLRIFVLALVVAPFVVTLLREPGHLAPRPVGHVPTVRASGLADAERELQETLALEREAQLAAGEGTLRVAYLRSTSRGGTYPLFALADVGAAVVLDGHVPSVNFQPTLGSHAPEVLRALGVTHVVFEGQPAALEAAVRRELEVVATHGPFTVARLFSGRAAALPAAARVIESSAGRRVVEVGAGGGAVLVPPYRRWRATDAGGAEVELERQRVWKRSFTVVKIGRDRARATPQRITLELVRTPLERVLGWVSLGVAVALVGWLVGWGWVQRRARAAGPRGAAVDETPGDAGGARRGVQAGAAVAVAGYVAATLLLGPARRLRTWEPAFERAAARQGVDALIPARDLVADGAYHTAWRGLRACDGLLDRDARAGCDPARERPTVRSTYRAPYLHRCVEVPVAPGGRAEIVFEGLRDDETVVIFARREDGGRRGLSYWMRAGASSDAGAGVELAREKLYGRLERVVSPSEHRGEITLRFENRGAETERPCVAAATGRPAMK
jgi:hypothetical protein